MVLLPKAFFQSDSKPAIEVSAVGCARNFIAFPKEGKVDFNPSRIERRMSMRTSEPIQLLLEKLKNCVVAESLLPVRLKACNRGVGGGVGEELVHNLATNGCGVAANYCTVKNLLCGLEACRKDLALGAGGSKDLCDICYGANAVSRDILKTAYVGSNVCCACVRCEHSLSCGKNCGNGDAVALVGEGLAGSETNGGRRNLNEGVLLVAQESDDSLCLLDDLLILGLGDLYVEFLLLADDSADILKESEKVATLLCENGGVSGYALDGEEGVEILDVLKVCGVKNDSHRATS